MRLSTIQKLCCPFDKSDLKLTVITNDLHDNILEGILHCPDCKRVYPIVKGIPIMSPDEYRELNLELPLLQHWQQYLENKTVEQFRLIEPKSTI